MKMKNLKVLIKLKGLHIGEIFMKSDILLRILVFPYSLLTGLFELIKNMTRNTSNKIRFNKSIIDNGTSIDKLSDIGANVHILNNCIINNCKISSFTYIGRNSLLQNTKIGKFCSIANDVFIGLGKHPSDHFSTSPIFYRIKNIFNIKIIEKDLDFIEYEQIEIGNDVWIGARAIIMDGIKIGDGAIVAANSVVTKDIPDYAVAAGVPAQIMKYRFSEEKIKKLVALRWWDWDINVIKKRINEINLL